MLCVFVCAKSSSSYCKLWVCVCGGVCVELFIKGKVLYLRCRIVPKMQHPVSGFSLFCQKQSESWQCDRTPVHPTVPTQPSFRKPPFFFFAGNVWNCLVTHRPNNKFSDKWEPVSGRKEIVFKRGILKGGTKRISFYHV